jgi:hypothetical protein
LNGWFTTSPVVGSVTVTDPSGVEEIYVIGANLINVEGLGETTARGDLIVSGDGIHDIKVTAKDCIGNTGAAEGSVNTATIKIDTTPPTITINVPDDGAHYVLRQPVQADWIVEDEVSGVNWENIEYTVLSGEYIDTNTIGSHEFFVKAEDEAGNTAEATVTYYVYYGFLGLLDPYSESRAFKLGSTIQLKWYYTDYYGNIVPSPDAQPQIIIRYNGVTTNNGETITPEDPGMSGLRYDPDTMMWQFNWQTKGLSAGTYSIWIKCGETGQTDGPFNIQLRK